MPFCIFMCACLSVYVCLSMCVCISVCVYVCMYVYQSVSSCICVCLYASVSMCFFHPSSVSSRVQKEEAYLHPCLKFWTWLIRNGDHIETFGRFEHLLRK